MTRLSVPSMNCGHCKGAVERAVASVDPDARTTVDLKTRTVEIDSAASQSALIAALATEGYPAAPAA